MELKFEKANIEMYHPDETPEVSIVEGYKVIGTPFDDDCPMGVIRAYYESSREDAGWVAVDIYTGYSLDGIPHRTRKAAAHDAVNWIRSISIMEFEKIQREGRSIFEQALRLSK